MTYQHKELAAGRWGKLSLAEQMANIGSEIERTINWRNKNHPDYSQRAFFRAIELLDLTKAYVKDAQLKEICRLKEVLVDYFMYDNQYGSTDESFQKYFLAFNYAARLQQIKQQF
jgi:hypothetical protein